MRAGWKLGMLDGLILLALLIPTIASAANTSFSLGINNSLIKSSDWPQLPGISIGHNKEWNLTESFIFEREFNFTYKRLNLENYLVWLHPGILSAYDLQIRIVYFEIPIFIEYSLAAVPSRIQLYLGPSLQCCLSGTVNRMHLKIIDDSYARGRSNIVPDHDISFIEDPGPVIAILDNSSLGVNFGLHYNLSGKTIELRWHISKLKTLDAVQFAKYYQTLSLIISF